MEQMCKWTEVESYGRCSNRMFACHTCASQNCRAGSLRDRPVRLRERAGMEKVSIGTEEGSWDLGIRPPCP